MSRKAARLLVLALCVLVVGAAAAVAMPSIYDAIVYAGDGVSCLTLSIGSNESQMHIAWHSPNETGRVEVRDEVSGNTVSYMSADTALEDENGYAHRVTVDGLLPGASYAYRLADSANQTPWYPFTTGNPNSFSFLVMGDPQIDSTKNAAKGWQATLSAAVTAFPEASFAVSCGDQVAVSSSEAQYETYLSPTELKSLPVMQTMGNHDYGSAAFQNHFYMPNVSPLGAGDEPAVSHGDYWFAYGKALFLNLNSNTLDITQHKRFMEQAIAANPDCLWRIVILHHSVYSEGIHFWDDTQIGADGRRLLWTPVFDALDIDAVFSGHDHCYTRTYQMRGNQPSAAAEVFSASGYARNPAGAVYFTLNSSSGSVFYSWAKSTQAFYTALRYQSYRPQFMTANVTDTRLTFTAYEVLEDGTLNETDRYAIEKR